VKLSVRLALPLLLVAAGVTGAVTAGLLVVLNRTTGAVAAQTGHQLGRITEHALEERAQALHDMAVVFAALRGDARARDRAWRHAPVTAAAVLDGALGRVRSAFGPAMDARDLMAIARGGTDRPVVRAADGLLVTGAARADRGGDLVVIGQRLDAGFAAELERTLQAPVSIATQGRTTAATFTGPVPSRDVYPVEVAVDTPGGGAATVTVYVPAAQVFRARRAALAVALGGGIMLLAAGFFFYWYAVIRITRPIGDLIAATERLAAGDLTAGLSAGAPAELGTLVRQFNRMADALKEAQGKLVHSAKLSSVGALVAGISHELNNPLYGLLGHAEHLMHKVPEGDPAREKLEIIVREARRMQRTLADLRGFTRPSARARATVDLAQVAREVVELVRHDAATAGVAIQAASPGGAAETLGSPDELRQVVLNLVLNALQATPRGGSITVRAAGPAITVEDSGAGMDASTLARVREPFFTTKPGRMGLGLSIAQEIVTAHGGNLRIDSRPGAGTRITVDLAPAAVAA